MAENPDTIDEAVGPGHFNEPQLGSQFETPHLWWCQFSQAPPEFRTFQEDSWLSEATTLASDLDWLLTSDDLEEEMMMMVRGAARIGEPVETSRHVAIPIEYFSKPSKISKETYHFQNATDAHSVSRESRDAQASVRYEDYANVDPKPSWATMLFKLLTGTTSPAASFLPHKSDQRKAPQCVHCRSDQQTCKQLENQNTCFRCLSKGLSCNLASPTPQFNSARSTEVIRHLGDMPVPSWFQHMYLPAYPHYQFSTFGTWYGYKKSLFQENDPRISVQDVVKHQIHASGQELLQDADVRSQPNHNRILRQKQKVTHWMSGIEVDSESDSLKDTIQHHREDEAELSDYASRSLCILATADKDYLMHSDCANKLASLSPGVCETESTSDLCAKLPLRYLQAIKLYGVLLLRLSWLKLHCVGSAKMTMSASGEKQSSQKGRDSKDSSTPSLEKRSLASTSQNTKANTTLDSQGQDDDGELSAQPPRKRRKADYISDTYSFACPYYKFNPFKYCEQTPGPHLYYNCGTCWLADTPTLKKHLWEKHTRPELYCPTCWAKFDRVDERDAHLKARHCLEGPCPFEEKMSSEQAAEIKIRRRAEEPKKTWYFIFSILFPGARIPISPFQEGRMSETLRLLVSIFREIDPQALQMYNTMVQTTGSQLPPPEAFITQQALNRVMDETSSLVRHTDTSIEQSLTALVNSTSSSYASYINDIRVPPEKSVAGQAIESADSSNAFVCHEDDLATIPLPTDFNKVFRDTLPHLDLGIQLPEQILNDLPWRIEDFELE